MYQPDMKHDSILNHYVVTITVYVCISTNLVNHLAMYKTLGEIE